MTVYVLVGGDGAYSDRSEGPVFVFEDEGAADDMCDRLNAIADEMNAALSDLRAAVGYTGSLPMESGVREPYRERALALGIHNLDNDYHVIETPMVRR